MAEAVDNTEPVEGEVLTFKSKKDKPKEERVTLFKIDDEEFTVPVKPKKAVVMRYLNVARKTNNDLMAAQSLVEELLGSAKWDRFLNWEDLDDDVMGSVITRCVELAIATFEDTSAK